MENLTELEKRLEFTYLAHNSFETPLDREDILRRGLATKSSGIDDYRHGVGVNPIEIIKVSKGSGVEVSKKRNIRKYILKPIF